MNTQTMIDWAFERPVGIQLKLVLIGLCLHSGPDGGGSIKLGKLAQGACTNLKGALGALTSLERAGFIIVHSHSAEAGTADSDILFGLCIEGRPS